MIIGGYRLMRLKYIREEKHAPYSPWKMVEYIITCTAQTAKWINLPAD
jgi:hypothetical protein